MKIEEKISNYLNEGSGLVVDWKLFKKWGKFNNVYYAEIKTNITVPKFIEKLKSLTGMSVDYKLKEDGIEVSLASSPRVYSIVMTDTVYNQLDKKGIIDKIESL